MIDIKGTGLQFFVFEKSDMNISKGPDFGACISESYECTKAIFAAQAYYRTLAEENEEYGPGETTAYLVTYDDITGNELVDEITLVWEAEKPDPNMYDEHSVWHSGGGGVL